MTEPATNKSDAQRIDRWLWFCRFFKSRTLASKLCAGRKIRVNREVVAKASAVIHVGDVLTFAQGDRIRVVRVVDLGTRRGPAAEAQALFEDLLPASVRELSSSDDRVPSRQPGSGRPTKKERRAIERLQDGET